MTHHTLIKDNLGGSDKFLECRCKISLILEENDLDQFVYGDVLEPEVDESKAAHKRIMDKAKRIIAYYIKDHLIPHAPSFKTPKEVYEDLKTLFEGKNINQKMTLRNQLKNENIQKSETIQS